MRLNAKNNAESLLTQAVSESDTAIHVEDASVFPDVPFLVSIDKEIMRVTEVSGNTLTVERAQEGTTAKSYDVGDSVENRFTAGTYEKLADDVDDLESELMSHKADDASDAHNATNISFIPPSGMTAIDVQDAITEVFQSGNNVKVAMVDALLSIDPSLPITYDSTWTEIEIATGQISLGLNYAIGKSTTSSNRILEVHGLGFRPKVIVARQQNYSSNFPERLNAIYAPRDLLETNGDVNMYTDEYGEGRSANAVLGDGMFSINCGRPSTEFSWIAIG